MSTVKTKSSTDVHVGDTYGNWTVIDATNEYVYPESTCYTKYTKGVLVQCPHGVQARRSISALKSGATKGCDQCGYESNFKGVGDLSASYIGSIKLGAIARNLEFTVTTEYLWALFEEQHRKCKLSNLDITLDPQYSSSCRKGQKFMSQTASLDRIDNEKGYTENNVQWIHKDINIMKLDHNQEYFIELCELISNTRKAEPRIRVIARFHIEGIHRWVKCPIPEVSYLKNYHRHIFHITGKSYVTHTDRDIEFIQQSHQMKQYLIDKYFNIEHNCCFFDDASCEMIADELATKFNLYECEVSEDGEGGSMVKHLG